MATKFWVLSNEDTKATYFRADWASKNNGEWKNHGTLGWNWIPTEETPIEEKPKPKPVQTKQKVKDDN